MRCCTLNLRHLPKSEYTAHIHTLNHEKVILFYNIPFYYLASVISVSSQKAGKTKKPKLVELSKEPKKTKGPKKTKAPKKNKALKKTKKPKKAKKAKNAPITTVPSSSPSLAPLTYPTCTVVGFPGDCTEPDNECFFLGPTDNV
jgi:hypothetical protein